jgi:hypothetical protein
MNLPDCPGSADSESSYSCLRHRWHCSMVSCADLHHPSVIVQILAEGKDTALPIQSRQGRSIRQVESMA